MYIVLITHVHMAETDSSEKLKNFNFLFISKHEFFVYRFAVTNINFSDEQELTMAHFKTYRKTHKGSKSKNAFKVWKKNGGKDRTGYIWKTHKNMHKKICPQHNAHHTK